MIVLADLFVYLKAEWLRQAIETKDHWLVAAFVAGFEIESVGGIDRCCWGCVCFTCVVDCDVFTGTAAVAPVADDDGWGFGCGTGIGAKPGKSANSL